MVSLQMSKECRDEPAGKRAGPEGLPLVFAAAGRPSEESTNGEPRSGSQHSNSGAAATKCVARKKPMPESSKAMAPIHRRMKLGKQSHRPNSTHVPKLRHTGKGAVPFDGLFPEFHVCSACESSPTRSVSTPFLLFPVFLIAEYVAVMSAIRP
jgi:hypothetical protein